MGIVTAYIEPSICLQGYSADTDVDDLHFSGQYHFAADFEVVQFESFIFPLVLHQLSLCQVRADIFLLFTIEGLVAFSSLLSGMSCTDEPFKKFISIFLSSSMTSLNSIPIPGGSFPASWPV